MKKLLIIMVMVLAFTTGHWLRPKSDIGMGIYFEDGRLVFDGGGNKFNANNVDIALPDWMKGILGDNRRDSVARNFHFDYTMDDPNVVILPSEPNEVDDAPIRKVGKWYVGTQNN